MTVTYVPALWRKHGGASKKMIRDIQWQLEVRVTKNAEAAARGAPYTEVTQFSCNCGRPDRALTAVTSQRSGDREGVLNSRLLFLLCSLHSLLCKFPKCELLYFFTNWESGQQRLQISLTIGIYVKQYLRVHEIQIENHIRLLCTVRTYLWWECWGGCVWEPILTQYSISNLGSE